MLKKANKVESANKKRSETQKLTDGKNNGRVPQVAAHVPDNNKPTISQKLAADTGVDRDTVIRRHATGQKLAARLGVNVDSLEKASADELLEAGEAATIAAQEKIEKSAEIRTSYRNTQDAAQSERAGLWQDTDPIPPWEWRKEKHLSHVYVWNFPEFTDGGRLTFDQ